MTNELSVLTQKLMADLENACKTAGEIEALGYTVTLKPANRWGKREPNRIDATITQDHEILVIKRGTIKTAA